MKKTPLKRNTPLKSNGVKLKRTPFKRKPIEKSSSEKAKPVRKTPSLTEQLDIVFSKYIRLRDMGACGYVVCISCGDIFPLDQVQCGHYFPRWHMATRWDEDNCHAECWKCNCCDANHLERYKKNLIIKIGQERYDALCDRVKETKQWSDYEIKDMIKRYKSLIKKFQ